MNTQDNTGLDAESKETNNLVILKDLYEAKGFKIKELGEAVGCESSRMSPSRMW